MHRATWWVLALALLVVGCPGAPPPKPPPKSAPRAAAPPEKVVWRESKSGLGFRLSNAEPERADQARLARPTPLGAKDAAALMARLPPFKQAAERKTVALRAKSIPPPRPGETVKTAFPPPASAGPPPAATTARELALLRHAPEGDVAVAPNLSITFSEPMVPVTSHGELAKGDVPVRLSPEPPGKWRWVGSQTLFFEPKGERFPAATKYTVTVPAGTRAASGHALGKSAEWTFTTPTLAIKDAFPERWGDPVDLQPVVYAEFNQRIDESALLAHVALRTGQETHPFRAATEDEIAKDEDVRSLSAQAQPHHWIAIKPTQDLPKGATVALVLEKGAPSAEGPLVPEQDQQETFRVHGPLVLESANCEWYGACPPLAPWSIRLSNAVDADSFETRMVTVEPALAGLRVDVSGRYLTVRGRSLGRTHYTLKLSPEIRDVFGQTLEQPATGKIDVGEAEPTLFSEQDSMLVLDPASDAKLSVYSVNRTVLKVRLYAVTPRDWDAYVKFRQAWDWDGRLTTPPGRLVSTRLVHPKGERDALVETRVDLGPALKDGAGQVLAIVEPPNQPKPRNRWSYREREWVRAWVQVTKLGLTAFKDADSASAWVTDLATGAAIPGATVSIPGGPVATSAQDGIARLALGPHGDELVATRGSDLVMLPGTNGSGTFEARPHGEGTRWFVFDDRHLYKPGETVHVKGWVRRITGGPDGDIARIRSHGPVSYSVRDPRGAELAKGSASLDDSDAFNLSFKLPDNANLGSARVVLEGPDGSSSVHGFEIQEFRRPEFEVGAQVSEGPHLVGGHALVTVSATYFAGGGLGGAETTWHVTAQDAAFSPPNREGYHFGKPARWWWWGGGDDEARRGTATWKSKTDADGRHRLRVDFDALDPAYPRQIDLAADVTDVNRQTWAARTSLLVHPAAVTVGLREESQLLRAGQSAQLDVIVTDLDGKSVVGRPVTLGMSRVETTYRGRKRIERETDKETCDVTSASDAVRCSLATHGGGLHRVTAVVKDDSGRASQSQIELWVLGEDPPANPGVGRERVQLVPDKKEYAGGDTAELLVAAPFAPAEGVLTLRRGGLVKLVRFHLDKKTDTLKVKLDPAWIPDVVARVDLVGQQVRDAENGEPDPSLPLRPAAASGQTTLSVPPTDRSLEIVVTPEKKALAPGASTRIGLTVHDAQGHAVRGASVALVAVDESVLALAGYDFPDPLAVFYPSRGDGVADFETRLRIALMHPDTARMQPRAKSLAHAESEMADGFGGGGGKMAKKPMPMRAMAAPQPMASAAAPQAPPPETKARDKSKAGEAPDTTPLAMRSNFDPLAAFVPRLTTDANGRASAVVKLPDNLTRYRVVAVASAGDKQFGKAESDVTARLPLMVRPSAPRFLNFGDRFELPVVLQNQTVHPLVADVAVRADNASFTGPSAVRVQVPANDRVEVRFPTAAGEPGTARFQIGAVSAAGSDASEIELPVWTPATTEAFATYGQIDQGAIAQPVKMPAGVFTEVGDLSITTSSTALAGLSDAVLYLVRYPFDCNEQIASRMLAIAALKDVLGAFSAPGLPSRDKLIATIAADEKKLGQRQHWSGGWDWWRRDRQPDPFVSVHVTHALVRSRLKGFSVPPVMLANALGYLRTIRSHFPPWYPEQARRTVRAYSLYVRNLHGDDVKREARELYHEAGSPDGLSMDALGFILPTISKDPQATSELTAIRRYLDNRIAETAGKAHFVTGVSDEAHVTLDSSRKTDGILLEAMIDDRPDSDVIPKVASGLLAHRKRGHWLNTQENVFVLLGLDRYFNQYEKVTPDFVARAWLGDRFAAEHAFKGRSVDRKQVEIPLSTLAQMRGTQNVTIAKDGPGRLYYRVGMQYVPKDLRPPPFEAGFSVSRQYEGADAPGDVSRDRDGVWHVKLGALVRVRIEMVAPARRYHVALVDPIPAGFEAQNPSLAMTGTIPRDPKQAQGGVPWWWSSAWYEHQNMRDERVEAFASLLYGGVYSYSYVARATTPGAFVVPPPKAEEMYDPETFGRGPGDRVVIQ